MALGVVFFFAWISDRFQQRGLAVFLGIVCYLVTLVAARTGVVGAGKWGRWGLWTAVNAFAVGYHPSHNTWLQLNCRDPRERSVSIAYVSVSLSTFLTLLPFSHSLVAGLFGYQQHTKADFANTLLQAMGHVRNNRSHVRNTILPRTRCAYIRERTHDYDWSRLCRSSTCYCARDYLLGLQSQSCEAE